MVSNNRLSEEGMLVIIMDDNGKTKIPQNIVSQSAGILNKNIASSNCILTITKNIQ